MTRVAAEYPGTRQHQALLQAVVAHYEYDPRVLAVIVFGSLGRGTWDAYSDLDLDVIIADGAQVEIGQELRRLCDAFVSIGERAALIIPEGDDEGDIVLESLAQLSIRYHPLSATSPNIVDSLRVLSGHLDQAVIQAAGLANHTRPERPLGQLLDVCVRYAAVAQVALQRKRLWAAVEILHRMRGILMELFTRTHGGQRACQFFEAEADARLQASLGATLPQSDLHSAHEALMRCLDILEHDLAAWTGAQAGLTDAQRAILHGVRAGLPKCD